ncbi:unnamed protein product [Urochloa decumbens]|uniref:DUF1618 domain-containing protein n=1 Tax=Urochloa decumbens TaxID=240449 RepID=A0ABC9ARE2_9POAL
MLRYLGLSCFRCRSSIVGLRSIHQIPSRRSRLDLLPAAANDPAAGWVLLNRYGIRTDDSFVADAKTVAYARTDTGQKLRVSFGHAPPPASSFFHYDFLECTPGLEDIDDAEECEEDGDNTDECEEDGDTDDECEEEGDTDDECEEQEVDIDKLNITVVGAHRDWALMELTYPRSYDFEDHHFLYRAGGAASPATLSRLPDRIFLTKAEQAYLSPPTHRRPDFEDTCLLRLGDNDMMLVELGLMYDRDARRYMAEFCLLRNGMSQWELVEPVPIIRDEGGKDIEQLHTQCGRNTIIPLGDRFLCWVKYISGFLLCDMEDEESPKVRYVPLPPGVCWDPKGYERDMSIKHSKNMGAVGLSAVGFVSIDPRCCCGGTGKSTCSHSRYAFTINTWLMDINSIKEPLTWVKDGEIDCEELWRLPGYEGLPRANPMCPIVCLDNPDVVCFLVSNNAFVSSYEDRELWMCQLNIKTKLLSVVPYTDDRQGAYDHLPASLHSSAANTG